MEPWQKYLLPNPHSKKLKFFNSIVQQVYESAFRHKQAGFKNYLLEQQQMRWALNNKIEELSNKANNLLKNEKYGMCQNIIRFISGVKSYKSSDVAKCESCLSTINNTLNIASDLRSSIDKKRKELFLVDHTLNLFASDELAYLEEARGQITTLHKELQSASNKLTTAHINLAKKFPLGAKHASTSRRHIKENKRKTRKTKEKRLKQRARNLLGNLASIEVAGEIFDSIDENGRFTPVDSINAEFTKKLSRRLHLDPLLWLLERGVFSTILANNLEQVAAILRPQSSGSTCRGGLTVAVELDDARLKMTSSNRMMRLKMTSSNRMVRL